MKNPTKATFEQAQSLAIEFGLLTRPVGEIPGIGKITVATGLNYSQAWCFLTRLQIVEAAPALDLKAVTDAAMANPTKPDGSRTSEWLAFQKAVADARAAGNSWGLIGVRCNRPEGMIRKVFKDATGTKSEGLRNGRGGRWLLDEPMLYAGDRQVTGIALPAPLRKSEIRAYAARLDALENLPEDRKELVKLAKEIGVPAKGSAKVLAEAIRAHLAATPEAPEAVEA